MSTLRLGAVSGHHGVEFKAKAGEVHALQTGARLVYRLPMCKREAFGESLPDDIDFFSHAAAPPPELDFRMVVERTRRRALERRCAMRAAKLVAARAVVSG